MRTLLITLSLLGNCATAEEATPRSGRELAHDWQKGNCLACHQIPRDPSAVSSANIGPVLEDVKARFPDRGALREQIWDARTRNPETVMPPFGVNGILSAEEVDKIIDYLHAL